MPPSRTGVRPAAHTAPRRNSRRDRAARDNSCCPARRPPACRRSPFRNHPPSPLRGRVCDKRPHRRRRSRALDRARRSPPCGDFHRAARCRGCIARAASSDCAKGRAAKKICLASRDRSARGRFRSRSMTADGSASPSARDGRRRSPRRNDRAGRARRHAHNESPADREGGAPRFRNRARLRASGRRAHAPFRARGFFRARASCVGEVAAGAAPATVGPSTIAARFGLGAARPSGGRKKPNVMVIAKFSRKGNSSNDLRNIKSIDGCRDTIFGRILKFIRFAIGAFSSSTKCREARWRRTARPESLVTSIYRDYSCPSVG